MLYTYVLVFVVGYGVPLGYLFDRILAVLASSAPVERVFFYQWAQHPATSCENVRQVAGVTVFAKCSIFS